MQADTADRLLGRLRDEVAAPSVYPAFEVPGDRYLSRDRFERERAVVAKLPRIVLPSSSLAAGACVPVDAAGQSLLLVRDAGGTARAFFNSCRHRGTRLVDAPCAAKAITCPYHAWTYDLDGSLRHVPHDKMFGGIDLATRGLAAVPVEERHGLIWLGTGIAAHLGALDRDLAALALDQHVAWKTSRVTRRCNWKLVVEAFLDGYHIRTLHRDSVYRFFIDAASVAEPVGDHVRAMTARRTLRDGTAGDVRLLATPSFSLFPATTIIAHPDFVSVVRVHPLAPDSTEWEHTMLVPAERAAETDHWAKSWALIEDGVFQSEDLWVCEQAQRGLESGGLDTVVFGALEHAARYFHAALDRHLG